MEKEITRDTIEIVDINELISMSDFYLNTDTKDSIMYEPLDWYKVDIEDGTGTNSSK